MSNKKLNGKTFIISGISSGIGKEIARELIEKHGVKVYGIARNEQRILDFKQELKNKDNLLGYFLFDVSIEENWINLKKYFYEKDIKINGIINCAGILPKFSTFENTSVKDFRNIIDVNFYSCIYACEHILPILDKTTLQYVVNVASSASLVTFSGISGYASSKSALKSFTLCLASELDKKVNVTCICPGTTDTGIFRNQNATEKESRLIKKICSSPQKIAKKSIKAIIRGKKLKIVGYDAKLMNFFYKLAPNLTSKIISKILKKSGLSIFKQI